VSSKPVIHNLVNNLEHFLKKSESSSITSPDSDAKRTTLPSHAASSDDALDMHVVVWIHYAFPARICDGLQRLESGEKPPRGHHIACSVMRHFAAGMHTRCTMKNTDTRTHMHTHYAMYRDRFSLAMFVYKHGQRKHVYTCPRKHPHTHPHTSMHEHTQTHTGPHN